MSDVSKHFKDLTGSGTTLDVDDVSFKFGARVLEAPTYISTTNYDYSKGEYADWVMEFDGGSSSMKMPKDKVKLRLVVEPAPFAVTFWRHESYQNDIRAAKNQETHDYYDKLSAWSEVEIKAKNKD